MIKSKFVTMVTSLVLVGATTISTTTFAKEQDFSVYAAVSLVAVAQERIRIDPELRTHQFMDEFFAINLDLRAQYRGFFLELPGNSQDTEDGQYAGPAIGYNFYNSEYWAWDIYFAKTAQEVDYQLRSAVGIYQIVRENDERAGVRVSGYFDRLLTQFTVMPHSFSAAIDGFEATASARYDWQIRNLNVYVGAGARYRSSEVWTHIYGVSESDAEQIAELVGDFAQADDIADYFAPYEVTSGVALSMRTGFEYPLTESWVVGGFINAERLPTGVANSPFRGGDNLNLNTQLSITYVF